MKLYAFYIVQPKYTDDPIIDKVRRRNTTTSSRKPMLYAVTTDKKLAKVFEFDRSNKFKKYVKTVSTKDAMIFLNNHSSRVLDIRGYDYPTYTANKKGGMKIGVKNIVSTRYEEQVSFDDVSILDDVSSMFSYSPSVNMLSNKLPYQIKPKYDRAIGALGFYDIITHGSIIRGEHGFPNDEDDSGYYDMVEDIAMRIDMLSLAKNVYGAFISEFGWTFKQ